MISQNQPLRAPPDFFAAPLDGGLRQLSAILQTLSPATAVAGLNELSRQFSFHCEQPPVLRVEYSPSGQAHPHATTRYRLLEHIDVSNAIVDLLRAKELGANNLNFHIPHEAQFRIHRNDERSHCFMDAVDRVGELLGVQTLWENSPILNVPEYSIATQTDLIPQNRRLCLDVGHLALGAQSHDTAFRRIDTFLKEYGTQIHHLHLHINDLVHDQHVSDPNQVIAYLGTARFRELTNGRTYIFEKGS